MTAGIGVWHGLECGEAEDYTGWYGGAAQGAVGSVAGVELAVERGAAWIIKGTTYGGRAKKTPSCYAPTCLFGPRSDNLIAQSAQSDLRHLLSIKQLNRWATANSNILMMTEAVRRWDSTLLLVHIRESQGAIVV